MLPALFNATVIWLCSLLLYELLLKRETFHRLNRFYLLFTFVIGITFPLLPWGGAVHLTIGEAPFQQFPAIEGHAGAALPGGVPFQSEGVLQSPDWIFLFYLAGVIGSSLFLFLDCYKLWRLARQSAICRQGHWKIAETGLPHGPFSFGNILFVGRQSAYTPQQWQMVLAHEGAHFHHRHLFDLTLLQAAQIFLWFHPLVYLYRHRLRLLHEYEADRLQEGDTGDYGRFLLQQATVSTPYSLTHELHFSPLKKRIHMLTKNPSKRTTQWRFLILLPLLSLSLWCCAQNGPELAVDIKGDYAMRHDAVVEYPKNPMPADTIKVLDPVTGEWQTIIMHMDLVPVTINKQPIAHREELSTTPQCISPGGEFGMEYLIEKAQLRPLLEELQDGTYYLAISEIIVDSSGKIAFFRLDALPINDDPSKGVKAADLLPATTSEVQVKVQQLKPVPMSFQEKTKLKIQKQLSQVLLGERVAFTPAKNKSGVLSPYFLDFENHTSGFLLRGTFAVKGHKLLGLEYSL